MIIGIGTDITDIVRIRDAIRQNGDRFLDRCFAAEERAYVDNKYRDEKARAGSYAKRWAAKEAVVKAVGRSLAAIGEFSLSLQDDLSAQVETCSSPELQGSWFIQAWKREAQYWLTLAVKVLG